MTTSADIEFAPRPQFGLKSLFLVMTAAAVVLGPTYWFGPGYLISVVFSLLLYGLCVRAYSADFRGGAIGIAGLGLFLGFVFAIVSIVFFAHTFWNLVVCALFAAAQVRPKVFRIGLGAVLASVYAFAIFAAAGDITEYRSAMARYPLVSLEPRLAFEKTTGAEAPSAKDEIVFAAAVVNHLDEQDEYQDSRYNRRQWALRMLHERAHHDFVFTPGIGVGRMPSFRPQMVELEPDPPFTMPWAIELAPPNSARTGLFDLHRTAASDFLEPDRIGYARSRMEVAGFNAHKLVGLRNVPSSTNQVTTKWQVSRLELVSLLRHAEPRVYIAKTMPAMDQLADVPHRALNDFEKGALPRLSSKQDIAVKQEPAHIEMLGAIRASTTCLECHQVARGSLLGAFSYEIVPPESAEHKTAYAEPPR